MKPKPKTPVPHAFVLEELYPLHPITRAMFGCTAVYIGEKIMLALRDKPTATGDNGVWLATTHDHHESLRREVVQKFLFFCGDGVLLSLSSHEFWRGYFC